MKCGLFQVQETIEVKVEKYEVKICSEACKL